MSSDSEASKPKIFIANVIDTPSLGKLRIRLNHAIGITSSGAISFIQPLSEAAEEPSSRRTELLQIAENHGFSLEQADVKDLKGTGTQCKFLFPGFIDTHTHAPQYANTGLFGSSTLLDWLETYTFPMESSFSDIKRAELVYPRVVDRLLSNGTTCAAYHATIHVAATNYLVDVCKAKGQRALIGRVCMDRMSPKDYRDESTEAATRDSELCIEYARKVDPEGELVRPVVTPRFAPSCKGETLLAMGTLAARRQTWIQTHMSENQKEIALVQELFPKAKDYTSVYDETNLLTNRTILAHVIHVSDQEKETIQRRGSKISHCPASNTCLASGACPVRKLLKAGLDVSLGTDMSGGYSPSILEMARQAMGVSRYLAMNGDEDAKLSVAEVLYLATMGGARCVGLETKVGTFEEGKDFDAQLIGLDVADLAPLDGGNSPMDIFKWQSWNERVAKWLYCGDDRNVKDVWVKGRSVRP
ncbi:MAG: hypothetical protein M1828_001464 [Chrysothrix sp. TS-e1954]|nr:MAG: hypothetical protein M1828_001464 [Chrysothrix sp. TS-e1954]